MTAGVIVQARVPGVSVAFMAEVDTDDGNHRSLRKSLTSEQSYTWSPGTFVESEIAILAIQSKYELDITINGDTLTLLGSRAKDFGFIYADNGLRTLGDLWFAGNITNIVFENKVTSANPITVLLASMEDVASGSGSA